MKKPYYIERWEWRLMRIETAENGDRCEWRQVRIEGCRSSCAGAVVLN
jgi:hypothetical protein